MCIYTVGGKHKSRPAYAPAKLCGPLSFFERPNYSNLFNVNSTLIQE